MKTPTELKALRRVAEASPNPDSVLCIARDTLTALLDDLDAKGLGPFEKRCADALADEAAALVALRQLDSRSALADALLNYRDPPMTDRSDRIAELETKLDAQARMLARFENMDQNWVHCEACQRWTEPKDMRDDPEGGGGCACLWCAKLYAQASVIAAAEEMRKRFPSGDYDDVDLAAFDAALAAAKPPAEGVADANDAESQQAG